MKRIYPVSGGELYRDGKSPELCIFVHGLGGNADGKYWGSTFDLLRHERSLLGSLDFGYWNFPSSANPIANLMSLPRRGRSLSNVPEVVLQLVELLSMLQREFGYKQIRLIGHSLGGAISLMAAVYIAAENGRALVSRVGMMSTPLVPNWLAKKISYLTSMNPHISWLASNDLNILFDSVLPCALQESIWVSYTYFGRDEIVEPSRHIEFSRRFDVDGAHSMTSSIDSRNNPAYIHMLNWMLKPDD